MQDILSRNPQLKVKVFACVWEPILFTDWLKPGAGVLARLSDPLVDQIWDRQHLVAKQLAKDARAPQPKPNTIVTASFHPSKLA